MGADSKIEWCRHTWNPWLGCTEVSPACDHCYARVMMQDRFKRVTWGAGEDRVKTSDALWNAPLKWDRDAAALGELHTVFCLSLGDIWDNEVDPVWRRKAFDRMRETSNLIYLLLSKRIGNAVEMAADAGGLPPNAALGATMINQSEWDRDSGKLEDAARKLSPVYTFASVEPMLGRISITGYCPDQVICGGESGPEWRDMPADWARELNDQVWSRGKAFFMKQMANKAPIPDDLIVRERLI